MVLMDNGEAFNVSQDPLRFTFLKDHSGNSFSIDKIYTKSSN